MKPPGGTSLEMTRTRPTSVEPERFSPTFYPYGSLTVESASYFWNTSDPSVPTKRRDATHGEPEATDREPRPPPVVSCGAFGTAATQMFVRRHSGANRRVRRMPRETAAT